MVDEQMKVVFIEAQEQCGSYHIAANPVGVCGTFQKQLAGSEQNVKPFSEGQQFVAGLVLLHIVVYIFRGLHQSVFRLLSPSFCGVRHHYRRILQRDCTFHICQDAVFEIISFIPYLSAHTQSHHNAKLQPFSNISKMLQENDL